jgi:hypothetical protein
MDFLLLIEELVDLELSPHLQRAHNDRLFCGSRNVWSAARLQGKSEGSIDRSAQMYSAFVWRAESPGHDELRCVLFLINGTVMEDHLREQVASTPLGTVRSS